VSHRDAYALLLVVALIWAGNFPLSKLGLVELGPLTLSAARALIAAPLLALTSRALEGPLPPLARRDWAAAIVLGLTGFVGNSTLWYAGLRHTSPANAGIIGAAAPVVVAPPPPTVIHYPHGRYELHLQGQQYVWVWIPVTPPPPPPPPAAAPPPTQ